MASPRSARSTGPEGPKHRPVRSQSTRSPSVTPISWPETSFHAAVRSGSVSRIGTRVSVPTSGARAGVVDDVHSCPCCENRIAVGQPRYPSPPRIKIRTGSPFGSCGVRSSYRDDAVSSVGSSARRSAVRAGRRRRHSAKATPDTARRRERRHAPGAAKGHALQTEERAEDQRQREADRRREGEPHVGRRRNQPPRPSSPVTRARNATSASRIRRDGAASSGGTTRSTAAGRAPARCARNTPPSTVTMPGPDAKDPGSSRKVGARRRSRRPRAAAAPHRPRSSRSSGRGPSAPREPPCRPRTRRDRRVPRAFPGRRRSEGSTEGREHPHPAERAPGSLDTITTSASASTASAYASAGRIAARSAGAIAGAARTRS